MSLDNDIQERMKELGEVGKRQGFLRFLYHSLQDEQRRDDSSSFHFAGIHTLDFMLRNLVLGKLDQHYRTAVISAMYSYRGLDPCPAKGSKKGPSSVYRISLFGRVHNLLTVPGEPSDNQTIDVIVKVRELDVNFGFAHEGQRVIRYSRRKDIFSKSVPGDPRNWQAFGIRKVARGGSFSFGRPYCVGDALSDQHLIIFQNEDQTYIFDLFGQRIPETDRDQTIDRINARKVSRIKGLVEGFDLISYCSSISEELSALWSKDPSIGSNTGYNILVDAEFRYNVRPDGSINFCFHKGSKKGRLHVSKKYQGKDVSLRIYGPFGLIYLDGRPIGASHVQEGFRYDKMKKDPVSDPGMFSVKTIRGDRSLVVTVGPNRYHFSRSEIERSADSGLEQYEDLGVLSVVIPSLQYQHFEALLRDGHGRFSSAKIQPHKISPAYKLVLREKARTS
ncbi:hypothetical protein GF351_01475 [Candidatus Woesearchaeota archaeon]|nr:hypothetical protein [Candidatus Woesearchaeota archaeon]